MQDVDMQQARGDLQAHARLGLGARASLAHHLAEYGPLPEIGRRHGNRPGPLVDELLAAGLRGRGGGWFPTHLKLSAVVQSSASRRLSRSRHPVVIGNAMEGEPASSKDQALLLSSPHLVLDGIIAAAITIGARDAFIALHRGSPAIASVSAALEERRQARLDPIAINIVTPPARYVASEESALAHWVGEGIAKPVFPDRPFQRGADGRPTLVQNAETLAHMALIARHGGKWFASVGDEAAPGTTLVSVGGAVANPGVIEVPTGTSVAEILAACGGITEPVRGYLTGGYGGGWVAAEGFDQVGWAPDPVRAARGVIGASVLWAVGESLCPLDEMMRVTAWMAGETAGQCGPCMYGLPSVSDDVRQLALRQMAPGDIRRLTTRLALVSNRGGCKHPDGTARFVSTGLHAFNDEVLLHLDGKCSLADRRGNARGALPVPTPRLPRMDPMGKDFE